MQTLRYRIRGRIALWRFLAGSNGWILVAVASAAVGLVGALTSSALGLTALTLILLEGALVARDLDTIKKSSHRYVKVGERDVHALVDMRLPANVQDDVRIIAQDGFALTDAAVNAALFDEPHIPVVMADEPVTLPPLAREMAPSVLTAAFNTGRVLFNSPKPSLRTDLDAHACQRGDPVTIARTDYFANLVTNEITGQQFTSSTTEQVAYDGTSMVVANGVLLGLREAPVANIIGASTLAITSDNVLVVPTHTRHATIGAGLMVPSGSGSVDQPDIDEHPDVCGFARTSMERELREECGVPRDVELRTRIIGAARYVHRGAKPEFFGVTRIDAPFDALAIPKNEQAFMAKLTPVAVALDSADALIADLQAFEAEHDSQINIGLRTNLHLLTQQLTERGDQVLAHLTA